MGANCVRDPPSRVGVPAPLEGVVWEEREALTHKVPNPKVGEKLEESVGPPNPPPFVPEIVGVEDAYGRVKEPLGVGVNSAGLGDWVLKVAKEGVPPPGLEGVPPLIKVPLVKGLDVPPKPLEDVPTVVAVPPPKLLVAVDCSPPPPPIVEEGYWVAEAVPPPTPPKEIVGATTVGVGLETRDRVDKCRGEKDTV